MPESYRAPGRSVDKSTAAALVALCVLTCAAFRPAAARGLPDAKTGTHGKPIRLLFVVAKEGRRPKAEIDEEYRRHLQEQSFAVNVILSNRRLTLDYLKQFNGVVIVGMASTRLIGYHAPHLRKGSRMAKKSRLRRSSSGSAATR